MSNTTIEVKAKSKTGKGIVGADEVWFNTGKGVNFNDIEKGDVVDLTYNGDSGVNFVSAYKKTNGAALKPSVPPVPSLPRTTVTETPAPGGEAPVAKATKKVDSETMTKADWANKDLAIERIAIFKSVLESPAYAQLVVGKRQDDAFQVGGLMVDFFLNKLDGLR